MKLAIVGSRDYTNYYQLKIIIAKTLKKWNMKISDVTLVVSGGAKGADTLASQWAKEYKKPITMFIPDWKAFGKAAGPMRNTDIVNECTHMIAFPSTKGKGTQDSIKKARNDNKLVEVFYIDKPKERRATLSDYL
jgi:hypothetical protein